MVILGLPLAVLATTSDNLGVVLQASQARGAPSELALEPALIVRLAGMRKWVAGGVLLVLGVVLQTAALTQAPLTVVQPTVGLGLVVLVVSSARLLGQRIRAVQVGAMLALAASIAGIALLRPGTVNRIPSPEVLGVVTGVAALVATVPYVIHVRARRTVSAAALAVAAGTAYAAVAIVLKAIADCLHSGEWTAVALLCLPLALLGSSGFLLEETALTSGAPTTVDPIVMLFQIGAPVAIALTLLGESAPHGLAAVGFAACVVVSVAATVQLARTPGLDAARAKQPRDSPRRQGSQPQEG
jgi:hypothetical protein